jgi:hypothetical protein
MLRNNVEKCEEPLKIGRLTHRGNQPAQLLQDALEAMEWS